MLLILYGGALRHSDKGDPKKICFRASNTPLYIKSVEDGNKLKIRNSSLSVTNLKNILDNFQYILKFQLEYQTKT
ncbi:hypothetical protein BC008_44305 [Mastigocoleus testarum BC008]|uniref:Uncharacterized protein n=1 Tax=Mastigocoleus testarum BC008 TaxID=371196 RepID=A0A0V7ZSW4_9CYAN|nr:hypothetical protein BC008_44305 [Mastigocoleus testarum BC008]